MIIFSSKCQFEEKNEKKGTHIGGGGNRKNEEIFSCMLFGTKERQESTIPLIILFGIILKEKERANYANNLGIILKKF